MIQFAPLTAISAVVRQMNRSTQAVRRTGRHAPRAEVVARSIEWTADTTKQTA